MDQELPLQFQYCNAYYIGICLQIIFQMPTEYVSKYLGLGFLIHILQAFEIMIYSQCLETSVGPQAEGLRPQPKIQDLRLRLRWPKFKAIPTAEGIIRSFLRFVSKMEANIQLSCVFQYTSATCDGKVIKLSTK